jgi:beta-glucanase (GH16 family)
MNSRMFSGVAALLAAASLTACSTHAPGISSGPTSYAIDEPGGMPVGYALVWSDEFDKNGLPDSSKWGYDVHANATGWYNKELQYYALARKENSRVENGMLIIEARKESAEAFPDSKGLPQEYTSARLVTNDKASWKYGFFEVRAKVPCGQGLWPAIWTLADVPVLRWPLDGEIDLMEHVNDGAEIHFAVHTAAHNHAQNTQASNTNYVVVCDGSFHLYQLTWTADEIKIGMDGRNYLRYRNEGKGIEQWPFNEPQYMLLNVAVGGSWPGSPNDSTVFPARMEVDYVRIYQK